MHYIKLFSGLLLLGLSQASTATLLDFTDADLINSMTYVNGGYRGDVDGIGFTLTAAGGRLNFNQAYDGYIAPACQTGGGSLSCDRDGIGIRDDEITGNGVQSIILSFDSVVSLNSFNFLDLYVNPYNGEAREQATISVDNAFFATVDAIGSVGDGGYAFYSGTPAFGQIVQFTAASGSQYWDDYNNDFAFAGVEVTSVGVPEPSTFLLLVPALLGMFGARRLK